MKEWNVNIFRDVEKKIQNVFFIIKKHVIILVNKDTIFLIISSSLNILENFHFHASSSSEYCGC